MCDPRLGGAAWQGGSQCVCCVAYTFRARSAGAHVCAAHAAQLCNIHLSLLGRASRQPLLAWCHIIVALCHGACGGVQWNREGAPNPTTPTMPLVARPDFEPMRWYHAGVPHVAVLACLMLSWVQGLGVTPVSLASMHCSRRAARALGHCSGLAKAFSGTRPTVWSSSAA